MFNDESEDVPLRLSPWDILALVSNLVFQILESIAVFYRAITHMLINHADFVDYKKSFHEDVSRSIETITEGE